ncbi:M23 family metallopeptidase [Treponema sp. C6A8]|uniref:M23 family metallopeptidase n=1 Tax=Treponema sp. C6A8 TaxID=1410609 RepID=UPI0006842490|nr:M23 family metallopeptidase [Treponema sp. C6A8]
MIKKFLLLTILSLSSLWAQGINQPIIIEKNKLPELDSLKAYVYIEEDGQKKQEKNFQFIQFSKIIEDNNIAVTAGREPEYIFYKYKVSEKFSVLELCARCNIKYDTIVTLNSLASKDDVIEGKTLIIPTVQGLFIPLDKGQTAIEVLLQENYKNQNLTKSILYYKIEERSFVFLQGLRLTPTERAFFLDSSLMLPLAEDTFYVSSEFGKRKNPLSGQIKDHNGIDLAAQEGTPVYAVKDGDVAYTVNDDPTFGNYIILSHDLGKQTSVYAHLSKIFVDQYQHIKKGTVIGLVGHTGMATGDHLHFEIRKGGKAMNPREKLDF